MVKFFNELIYIQEKNNEIYQELLNTKTKNTLELESF
jgi:hypothetical protein